MSKTGAVRMVREIRDKQFNETKTKSKKELREYFKEKAAWAFEGLPKKVPAAPK